MALGPTGLTFECFFIFFRCVLFFVPGGPHVEDSVASKDA